MQKHFAKNISNIISRDDEVLGLAAAGSWITDELDEYSDLDLILVTKEKINSKEKMMQYTVKFGKLLAAFTGEHVGEPRLLICLYEDPLIHVDIKFLIPEEFRNRVEDPVILFEREGLLSKTINEYPSAWPQPDPQWIEDRFWVWVHYMAVKIARGELLETLSSLDFLRVHVLSPLMHLNNKQNNRGLRKAETRLSVDQSEHLKRTIATYDAGSILTAVHAAIDSYLALRKEIFNGTLRSDAETKSREYLNEVKKRFSLSL